MYHLAFTTQFSEGIHSLPKDIYPIISRCMRALEQDPYQKLNNAKRLKNMRNTFRMRIGQHVRMTYQVFSKEGRIVLSTIGQHQNFYTRLGQNTCHVISAKEAQQIRAEIEGLLLKPTPSLAQPLSVAKPDKPELPVKFEVVEELISREELWLLKIPQVYWDAITAAGTLEDIQKIGMPKAIADRIEDYLTNPVSNQIGKLYSLGLNDAQSIAHTSLEDFLIALDPEQQRVVDFPVDGGPYQVKGGPGTGKSLIGLYRLKHLIETRKAESLFDQDKTPRYGFLTYTNTLVDTNKALINRLRGQLSNSGLLVCSTLDKEVRKLAELELGGKPDALNTRGVQKFLDEDVFPGLCSRLSGLDDLVKKLGTPYLASEIEEIIQAYNFKSLEEYASHPRRGRKTPLNQRERGLVWDVYQTFLDLCQKRRIQTFAEWRCLALRYLKAHPEYPRYAGLFVDEVQDLSKVARQICLELVLDRRFILLTADTGQSIYTVPPTWPETEPGISFRGRSVSLKRNYRTTQQTVSAIAALRDELDDGEEKSAQATAMFSGNKPVWQEAELGQHAEIAAKIANEYTNGSMQVNPGQIAIILREKSQAARYEAALKVVGLLGQVVDKYSPLDITAKHVHLIKAHSAKGLEFPFVIVPEVSDSTYPSSIALNAAIDDAQRSEVYELEQRLLYVALSRACLRLHMLVDAKNPSRFLEKLDKNQWEQA